VCAVDSYLNPATLGWLDDAYRLKTAGNADGLIPGEAAAAVLVRAEPKTAATEVTGLGFGVEPAPIRSDEPLRAAGLAQAVKAALAEARLGYHEIDFRLSDVTGESYGFKEVLLMEARVMRELRYTYQPVWHWSEAIGDTGAAAGVVQLVSADDAFRKGYAPGRSAICLTSAGPGARAAAVVRPVAR
jgi:3-oxoacyl-[acyl-carrier-protein] synthase-1